MAEVHLELRHNAHSHYVGAKYQHKCENVAPQKQRYTVRSSSPELYYHAHSAVQHLEIKRGAYGLGAFAKKELKRETKIGGGWVVFNFYYDTNVAMIRVCWRNSLPQF